MQKEVPRELTQNLKKIGKLLEECKEIARKNNIQFSIPDKTLYGTWDKHVGWLSSTQHCSGVL
jgi:hypothetical protein